MNGSLDLLIAVSLIFAVTGCGRQEAPSDAPGAEMTNASETAVSPPSDNSLLPASNELPPPAIQQNDALAPAPPQKADERFEAENSRFSLDGEEVVLKRGLSKVAAAPGSASSVTTKYLGKDARGDLTSDGKDEIAFWVTRDAAGSGQFYYVVVAINGENGYKTTNAFLVGDRIRPQSLRINSNTLQVNFVGRKKGEPMTSPPSVESVLLLKITPKGVLEGLMK